MFSRIFDSALAILLQQEITPLVRDLRAGKLVVKMHIENGTKVYRLGKP